MNNKDRFTALQLAREPRKVNKKLGANAGGLNFNKSDGAEPYGIMAANLLAENNGTIIWDIYDQNNGKVTRDGMGAFENFWQYCAAEYLAKGAGWKKRINVAEEQGNEFKKGFRVLRDWYGDQWDHTLYFLATSEHSALITTVTIHPDWEDGKGNTAMELQTRRDVKMFKGIGKSVAVRFKRLPTTEGKIDALRGLKELINDLERDQSWGAAPIRSRIESDD